MTSEYKEAQLTRLRWVTFILLVIVVLIVMMTRKPVENLVPSIPRPMDNVHDRMEIFIDKDLKWNPIRIETHIQNVLNQLKEVESPYFKPALLNDTRFEIDKYRD